MGELSLIAAIQAALGRREGSRVVRWIGDDGAVVRAGAFAASPSTSMVDGMHFRLGDGSTSPRTPAIARWPARCPISPRWAPSPARPTSRSCSRPAARRGRAGAAPRHGGAGRALRPTIAGGDVARGPALMIAVTVVGWADDRGGARGPRRRAAGRPRRRDRPARRLGGRARRARGPRATADERSSRAPAPRAAPARGARAGRRGRARDARRLRRPGADARRLARARAASARARRGALPLAPGVAEVAAQLGPTRRARRDRRRGLRAVRRVPPERRAAAEVRRRRG